MATHALTKPAKAVRLTVALTELTVKACFAGILPEVDIKNETKPPSSGPRRQSNSGLAWINFNEHTDRMQP